MNRSNGSHVFLEHIEPLSEGTFSCEINTDEPFFMSMQTQEDLRVYGKQLIIYKRIFTDTLKVLRISISN